MDAEELRVEDGRVVDRSGREFVCRSDANYPKPRHHRIDPESLRDGSIESICGEPLTLGSWEAVSRDSCSEKYSCQIDACFGDHDRRGSRIESISKTLEDMTVEEFDQITGCKPRS